MRRATALLIVAVFAFGGRAWAAQRGAAWTAPEIGQLRSEIDAWLGTSHALTGAHVGLYVVDTRTGVVLYARNVDDDFIPASNVKLVTGSTALARLGGDFRFSTVLLATAAPREGNLDGDLVLRGGGDALLRASDLVAAAGALAARGIRRVHGALYTDASYFDEQWYGSGWVIDDLPYSYAAPISALSLADNDLHVTVSAGSLVGDAATLTATPVSKAYSLLNMVTTGRGDSESTLTLERGPAAMVKLSGSIPLGAASLAIDAAIPDPPALAADVLARAFADYGIVLDKGHGVGTAPLAAVPLWRHDSEPLRLLLADFWYPSDNLIGELLLKELGVVGAGVPGRDEAGLALETAFLRGAGVDPATVSLVDGSGLSRYDQLTPRALVALLQYDWNSPNREVVLNALPVAGVRGSLRKRFIGTAAQGRIFAKSGGMLNVTNLSGYIATRRHGAATFSFLIDNALGEDSAIEALRARIFTRLVRD